LDAKKFPYKLIVFYFYTLQYRRLCSALFILEGFCGHKICLECVGGRGSAPDPARGAHDAPPGPLVGWEGGHPLHKNSIPSALDPRVFGARCSALRRLSSIAYCIPTCIFAIHHWEQGRQWAKAGPGGTFLMAHGEVVVCSYFRCCLFLARDSIYAIARCMPSPIRLSVYLSVCLSVTRVDQSKTVEVRIMQPSPQSKPHDSIFLTLNFIAKFQREDREQGRRVTQG